MPYNLLYTRSIASDDRIRFTDVPITSSSIMVDILSLRSPFYRIAGYAYSVVSDGLIDYERGKGYTLPFGKNRLQFPETVLPYYLEFFPKWGTKQAILSVYTGFPSPPSPTNPWVDFPAYDVAFRRAQSPSRLEYRQPIGSAVIQSMAFGFAEGIVNDGYLNWKRDDTSCWYASLSSLSFEGGTDAQGHSTAMTRPLGVIL